MADAPASTPASTGKATPAPTGTGKTGTPSSEAPKLMTFGDAAAFAEAEQMKTTEAAHKEMKGDGPNTMEDIAEEEDFGDDDDSDDLDEETSDEESDGETEEDAEEEREEDDADDDSEEETDAEDLDSDEVFLTQKVNGKTVNFTKKQVQDIVASGAHNIAYRHKIERQVAEERQLIAKDRTLIDQANEAITPAWEAFKKGDHSAVFYHLAKTKGLTKLQADRNLRAHLEPAILARYGITPEMAKAHREKYGDQLQILDEREELEFLKNERTERTKESETKAKVTPEQQFEKEFAPRRLKHGISDSEVSNAAGWIEKNDPKGGDASITADYIERVVLNKRIVKRAAEAIETKRPTLMRDQKFFDKVCKKVARNPDWSTAKVARYVEKLAREKVATKNDITRVTQDVSRKALKGKDKTRFESPKATQKTPMRFADLKGDDELA